MQAYQNPIVGVVENSTSALGSSSGNNSPFAYPQRVGEQDCRDYLRTGRCKYGESCKYNHPPNVQSGGGITSLNPSEPPFPIRPGEPACQYFLKHGTCKFGQTCKFNHPPNQKAHVPEQLLPQRPDEPDCIYFLRNGRCKYGVTCKYHHPISSFRSSPGNNDGRSNQVQTRYILVDPTNLVMISPNAAAPFAVQQNVYPNSPMLVSTSGVGSSPIMTSSLASSYETAVSHIGDYPTWQHVQAQRRVRLNSVSSSLSMDEYTQRNIRSESFSSLKQSHSGSSLKEMIGIPANVAPSPVIRSLKDEHNDEGLSQMTSVLLNMLDNEDSGIRDRRNESGQFIAASNASLQGNTMKRSYVDQAFQREISDSRFREGTTRNFQDSLQASPSISSTLFQDQGLSSGYRSLPSSFTNVFHDSSYHRDSSHEFLEPPQTLSDPIGKSNGFHGKEMMSENEHRGVLLSSVMEESQHAQNWSPSSWQPSTAMPSSFFPKI